MKKTFVKAAIALVATAFTFMSCASTSGSKSSAPTSVHPREYTIDLAESATGTTIHVVKNQYDVNHQSDPAMDFTKFVRKDKPQAGDTVHMYYKFSADHDISIARFSLIDPTVNYWLELAADGAMEFENIVAGEIYEGSYDIVLQNSVSGEFKVYISYNNKDHVEAGYAKQEDATDFTLYDVDGVETTDVLKELPASEVPVGPKTIKINLNEISAFTEVKTGHPWINGSQDMSQIENYQADISYMSLLEEPPVPGDILEIYWKAKADIDIPALKMFPVDHSASVGWWKEMVDDRSDENVIIAADIKAGETFEVFKTFVIDVEAASTDCNLRLYYDYDPETNGPGPCTIIRVKD
ncbi:MAG: hypothetical protein MJ188_10080 [Treponema sp.]|nr:hypothetical protein [Treponema sp.]